jgi:septum formation protein
MTAREPFDLILASTSRYRRELLERLRLPFTTRSPDVDEAALPGESPQASAIRLARAKAEAVARRFPGAVVIGSDQVAECAGLALGKPGGREAALAQLAACRGRDVVFHTAVCVLRSNDERGRDFVDTTRVAFRELRDDEIARYVDAEQPFDCAGSFKCEGLGVVLFDAIRSEDPTALVGLPLIALARTLRGFGFSLP